MAYTTPRTWNNEVISDAKLNQDLRDNVLDILASLHGDTSSTSAVLHAHKNGTYANRPAAGLAGREYYATDMGVVFVDNGTRWDVLGVNKRIASVFEDDFELSNFPGTIVGIPAGFTWALTVSGAGAAARNNGTPGFSRLQLSTGASVSGAQVTLSTQISGTTYLMDQASDRVPALWSSRFASSATTNQTLMAGLSVANPIQDGIYFKRVDTGSVGNWIGVCRNSATETVTTSTAFPGDTNQHWFEIEINALNSVKFYIDGTQLTPTISTNIPSTVNLNPQYYIVNAAVADKQLNLDFIQWIAKR